MKHLNKFNESRRNNYIDKAIVEECFIDIKSSIKYDVSFGVWRIDVPLPVIESNDEDIEHEIRISEEKIVILHDIKNALDKLKIEYTTLHHRIDDHDESDGYQLDCWRINIFLVE